MIADYPLDAVKTPDALRGPEENPNASPLE